MFRAASANLLRGFLMGAADIVPGVSGGTVALVLGIYERLVRSVRNGSAVLGATLRLDRRRASAALRSVEWRLLVPLLVGVGTAIFTLAHLLAGLLEDNPIEMAALFLGLVAGSTVVAWRLLTTRDARRILIVVTVTVGVFVLLGLREGTSEGTVGQLAEPALWAFFGAGAIAVCAMILPGISGAFILVMLGMYGPVLAAVTDRDLAVLAVVVLGAVIGLAFFSHALHWSLNSHYDSVMAALIGLMLGSMRVLWPWPAGVESTGLSAPDESFVPALLIATAALASVVGLDALGRRLGGRTTSDEIDELQAG